MDEKLSLGAELTSLAEVTRLEVFDGDDHVVSAWDVKDLQLSLQDGGRTLKIFYKRTGVEQVDHLPGFFLGLQDGTPLADPA